MNIDKVITALRARCLIFEGRVGGFGEYASIANDAALRPPCAYVVQLSDTPGDNESITGYRQTVSDRFGVLVALPNGDYRGQSSANLADVVRDELNRALLGWEVDENYYGIVYDGRALYQMSRAVSWYSYEYVADFVISGDDLGNPETWHAQELAALPKLKEIAVTVDAIDPRDTSQPGTGPDGRPETFFIERFDRTL